MPGGSTGVASMSFSRIYQEIWSLVTLQSWVSYKCVCSVGAWFGYWPNYLLPWYFDCFFSCKFPLQTNTGMRASNILGTPFKFLHIHYLWPSSHSIHRYIIYVVETALLNNLKSVVASHSTIFSRHLWVSLTILIQMIKLISVVKMLVGSSWLGTCSSSDHL